MSQTFNNQLTSSLKELLVHYDLEAGAVLASLQIEQTGSDRSHTRSESIFITQICRLMTQTSVVIVFAFDLSELKSRS